MTTYNEFQRELQKRGISGENAYMFTLIYERLIHMAKEIEDNASAMLALANSMQGLVQLNEQTQNRIKQIASGMSEAGVELGSVAYEPEEFEKNKKKN
jgi:uncharacterized membrane protein YukC